MIRFLISIFALSAAVSSCTAHHDDSNTSLKREHGWVLTKFTSKGADVPIIELDGNGPIALTLMIKGNAVSANGGINQMSGKAKIGRDGQIRISDSSTTEIRGPLNLMKQEENYLFGLTKMTEIEVRGDLLILSDGSAKNQMQFKAYVPPGPEPLIGTTWVYSGFEEEIKGGSSFAPDHGDPSPNLTFSEDGKVTGYGGVNRFFGAYEANLENGKVEIGALASTKKGGSNRAMKDEKELLQRLQAATGFSINGVELRLTKGKTALIFEAAE
ncbi:MAG: heat shock protein HslJ [Verrucomicrobiales bacterium]|jgi:heat shock protein HslJ